MNTSAHDELKNAAVLFDRELGLASVSGPDRVSWLQGMLTNDVSRLKTGQGCYAAHLNAQGKMLSHMIVLAEEEALWLVMERDNVAACVQELDKLLIMEDASISDRTEDFESISLAGAEAKTLLEVWVGVGAALVSIYDHIKVAGRRVLRTEWGYDVFVTPGEASEVRSELLESGAVTAGRTFWDLLRIEAGFPRYGVDVDQTTTFPELGDRGIDYDKGCYIGQEVVAKIKHLGHVNRNFVGLKLIDIQVPERGAAVHDSGREVGRITSAIRSPGVGSVIALAFVRRSSCSVGTQLMVDVAGERRWAEVVDLPFVGSST